jgi:hypothetical protein
METTKHCPGCRNDFYNGNNELGVKRCWSLKDAKLVTRFRLSINTPMSQKSGYVKTRVPDCYHENGFVYLNEIPNYAE